MSRKFFPIFEHHRQPLVSKQVFFKRMVRCIAFAFVLLAVTIFIGAAVYHYSEGLGWLEAALNSVLIMTGLGLVDTLHTTFGKMFTCFYALITAIVFYINLAVIFAPLIHRFLHEFHLEMGKISSEG